MVDFYRSARLAVWTAAVALAVRVVERVVVGIITAATVTITVSRPSRPTVTTRLISLG